MLAAPPTGPLVATAPSPGSQGEGPLPKQMEVAPPTSLPLTATSGTDVPEADSVLPRARDDLPPGAWVKRGAASGVSKLPWRIFWYSSKKQLVSLPSMRVAAPPTGCLEVASLLGGVRVLVQPAPSEDSPPGGCWKRAAAQGVAATGLPFSFSSAKISAELSLPRTMLAAPPTGPRRATPPSVVVCTSSVPRQTKDAPPGACVKRGAAMGIALTKASCTSSRLTKASFPHSLPKQMSDGPPTGPRVALVGASQELSPPKQTELEPPGA
mmetsp:Transcript_39438/g.91480  ORF Transcript_39438/g.91480 Transcript_39438/m.91480 type:complete len:268 (+) Transcript_39438:1796-2599(+)